MPGRPSNGSNPSEVMVASTVRATTGIAATVRPICRVTTRSRTHVRGWETAVADT